MSPNHDYQRLHGIGRRTSQGDDPSQQEIVFETNQV